MTPSITPVPQAGTFLLVLFQAPWAAAPTQGLRGDAGHSGMASWGGVGDPKILLSGGWHPSLVGLLSVWVRG